MPQTDPLQELRDAIDMIATTISEGTTEPKRELIEIIPPLTAGFAFEYVTNYGSLSIYDRDLQIAALRASGDAAARIYDFLLRASDSSHGKPEDLLDGVTEDEIHYFAQMLGVNASQSGDKSIITAMHSYIRRLTNIYDDTYLYE